VRDFSAVRASGTNVWFGKPFNKRSFLEDLKLTNGGWNKCWLCQMTIRESQH
jgi:hypothetical protein